MKGSGIRGGWRLSIAIGLCAVGAAAAPLRESVSEVFVSMDDKVWRLEIPYEGRWSHWAMNEPPRIVIDLIGAVSRLPNAPGLYTLDMPNGPVVALRTSQYKDEPGNRRMRITLLLREPVRYEVDRCENGIDIRIPRPERAQWGEFWELDIDSEGANREVTGQVVLPPQCDPQTFDVAAGQPAARTNEEQVVTVVPGPAGGGVEQVRMMRPSAGADTGTSASRGSIRPGDPAARALTSPTAEGAGERVIDLDDLTLENILSDTTFFELDEPSGAKSRERAWDTAAARLLESAQNRFLEGDTAGCLTELQTCDRFYVETTPGRQAALLRHLLLRSMGREVEAWIGPSPPHDGHWPLLIDPVFDHLHGTALKRKDLKLGVDLLEAWRRADVDSSRWAGAALQQAEAYLDDEQGERAAAWVAKALAAHPELAASPRAMLSHGLALSMQQQWEEAEAILQNVEASGDSTVVFRARAARADVYYRQQRYADAAGVYESLAQWEAPAVERDWALYQLGNCAAAQGDRAKARACYTVVMEASQDGFWTPFARMRLAELEAQGATRRR